MRRVVVSEASIDFPAELKRLRDASGVSSGGIGAIASFLGMVRGGEVTALELQHHPGMTEKSILRIVEEAERRWNLLSVTVIHRIGVLAPGDDIVLVLTAASHRPQAFDACEFLMDYLKTEAVFWKRETRGQQTAWVESTNDDRNRKMRWEAE